MSQSLSKMWTHLIFSTKDQYPFLGKPDIREHAFGVKLANYLCDLGQDPD
jgi:hypothetical protein